MKNNIGSSKYQIVKQKQVLETPWVKIVTKIVRDNQTNETKDFLCAKPKDYTSILLEDEMKRICLVRQFRPAIEAWSLEFPGGLVEKNEAPIKSIKREVYEETGLFKWQHIHQFNSISPEVGRLDNVMHAFYGTIASEVGDAWVQENGVEPVYLSKSSFRESIRRGEFNSAQHLAILSVAISEGIFSWN